MTLLALTLLVAVLPVFVPTDQAIFRRLTMRFGPLVGLLLIFLTAALMSTTLLVADFLTAGAPLTRNLPLIAFSAAISGGFLQVMAAATDPNSPRALRQEQQQVDAARQNAISNGLDPDEAEQFTREVWQATGRPIQTLMNGLFGFTVAFAGGGFHNAALFVVGASYLVGLGFGVNSATMLLLYVLPVAAGLADAVVLHAFTRLGRATPDGYWAFTFIAVGTISIGGFGLALKAACTAVAVWIVSLLGGPYADLSPWLETMLADPAGKGLAGSFVIGSTITWCIFSGLALALTVPKT